MICVNCELEKSESEFRKNKNNCKKCEAESSKVRYYKNKDVINKKQKNKRIIKRTLYNLEKGIDENTKECNECHIIKNSSEFAKGRHKCKPCIKLQDANRYNRNKDVILNQKKEYNTKNNDVIKAQRKKYRDKKRQELLQTTKKCKKCKKRKSNEEYAIYGKNNARRNYCIECGNLMCKNYKARNRDKISNYNKEYKGNHKDEIREYNRKWTANAIKTNPQYKIKSGLRIRMNKSLNGIKKSEITDKLLGCSIDFLFKWFQFRFVDNMTINNHGKEWHIDHVIPCSKFDLLQKENQQKCFHWTNLQPLNGTYNIIKGNKFDTFEIFNQASKLKEFTQNIYDDTFNEYQALITK